MATRAGLMDTILVSYADGTSTLRYKTYDPTTTDQAAAQDYLGLSLSQILALNASQPAAPAKPWTVVGAAPSTGLAHVFVPDVNEPSDAEKLLVTFGSYDPTNDEVYYHVNRPTNKYGQDSRTWLLFVKGQWWSYEEFNACPHKPRLPLRVEAFLVDTSQVKYQWRQNAIFYMANQTVNYI